MMETNAAEKQAEILQEIKASIWNESFESWANVGGSGQIRLC